MNLSLAMDDTNRTKLGSVFFGHQTYFNIVWLCIGACITISNLMVIFRLCKKRRRFRKGKRFAFALNMAISDFSNGPVLIGLSTVDLICKTNQGIFMHVMQILICFSSQLTAMNLTCFLIAQYFAIKHPLYYKTRFTNSIVSVLIASSWSFSGAFTCAKYFLALKPLREKGELGFIYFPHLDQCLRNAMIILNTSTFVYVFAVAVKRRRRHAFGHRGADRSNVSHAQLSTQESGEGESMLTSNDTNHRSVSQADMRNYRAITAAGCRLFIFFISILPINAYWIYMILSNDARSLIKAYMEAKSLAAYLLTLWFLRAVADPLITLISESRISIGRSQASQSEESRNSSLNSSRTHLHLNKLDSH